jgi:hypothetical protein
MEQEYNGKEFSGIRVSCPAPVGNVTCPIPTGSGGMETKPNKIFVFMSFERRPHFCVLLVFLAFHDDAKQRWGCQCSPTDTHDI